MPNAMIPYFSHLYAAVPKPCDHRG